MQVLRIGSFGPQSFGERGGYLPGTPTILRIFARGELGPGATPVHSNIVGQTPVQALPLPSNCRPKLTRVVLRHSALPSLREMGRSQVQTRHARVVGDKTWTLLLLQAFLSGLFANHAAPTIR
jgi:hypothetical protein